jgi:hypothetical protein
MYRRAIKLSLVLVPVAIGCGGSVAGARPRDMSQQTHEASAARHSEQAAEHATQYDPEALTDPGDCINYLGSCWGDNPTEQHRKDGEEHARAATAHRAASQALRDAEARSCQGVSDADRDESPLLIPEAIADVKAFMLDKEGYYERQSPREVGATIILVATPGVTAERLQRTIECHIARNASLGPGSDVPAMAPCPLALKGVSATVRSVGNGFAVDIAGEDDATAAEVLRRARTLARR